MSKIKIRLPKFIGRLLQNVLDKSALNPGQFVEAPEILKISRCTILYFKAENCISCGDIDIYIGQLCSSKNIDLRVIDASNNSLPDSVYGGQLILDRDGSIRKKYKVVIFPTLVMVKHSGEVCSVSVGESDKEKVSSALKLA